MLKQKKGKKSILDQIRKPVPKASQVIKSKKRRIEQREQEQEIREHLGG